MSALPQAGSISQFYSGREIFITGATGFMGKVLVERLLSTCPDIGRLLLLMRGKKELSAERRLSQLKDSQVFANLRQSNPKQLDKLCVVPGDITMPGLGITDDSLVDLQEVSIVFNSAATVKFDEALKKAIEQNVLSVMSLMEICDKLPNIQALVHVSTAYCNCEHSIVEEKVYPLKMPLEYFLCHYNEDIFELNTKKYVSPKPNTYTFTKAMAETAVQQHGNQGYSISIFRPTCVISSLKHPFPGWIDNINGPCGVAVGVGSGTLHAFRSRESAVADMLPVDMGIDMIIAVGWETVIDNLPTVRVYNGTISENPTTWGAFRHALEVYSRRHPHTNVLWYPTFTIVENRYVYKIMEFLYQTVPLHMIEYISCLLGHKKRLSYITINSRLRAMSSALQYFGLREWTFPNDNIRKLRDKMTPDDREIFNLDPKSICWENQLENFIIGVKKYLLKQNDQDLPAAKRRLNRLYVLHCCVSLFIPVILLRVLVRRKYSILRFINFMLSLFNNKRFDYINKIRSSHRLRLPMVLLGF